MVPLSNDHSLKPYHIILHRCKGTCDISASPKSKPCAVGSEQDVVVKGYAVDGSYKVVTLKNHTSCLCNCDAKCDWNKETLDETNCRCVSYGTPVTGSRKDPCEGKLFYKLNSSFFMKQIMNKANNYLLISSFEGYIIKCEL